jgi:phospholipase C
LQIVEKFSIGILVMSGYDKIAINIKQTIFVWMKKFVILVVIIVSIIVILPAVSGSLFQPVEKTPIKHVINIFFENHTFDNFFGIYPENPSSTQQPIINNISRPLNLLNDTALMGNLTAIPTGTFSTPDPIEGYTAYHIDWNHGKMNGWLQGSGPNSLTYYTSAQLGPLWDLAEEYGIAENYYAPRISESAPNTLYYLAGFSPVFNDYGPPPSIPINETIFGEMSKYNIPWGVYVSGDSKSFDMSNYIQGIGSFSSNINSWNTFIQQLNNGTLPSVSYVFSQGGNGYDMGAPGSLLKGELWLISLINHIEESPIWSSTAIFITWDDPGGYYDQVSPPTLDGNQLGMRLPLIVISPFSKEDYVSNTLLTHSSILAFIDYNWGIPALNGFVSDVNVPLDFFDFNTARAPMTFNFGSVITVPTDPNFNLSLNQAALNLSSTFPVSLQEPLDSLHYARQGAMNFTLSSIGAGVLVKEDVTLSPFYASPYFLLVLIIVAAVIAVLTPRRKI